jgi:hypothetical protein
MWKSHAEWPEHPDVYVKESDDSHPTEEAARAVCRMLERKGMGGERKIFPVRTWVTPP